LKYIKQGGKPEMKKFLSALLSAAMVLASVQIASFANDSNTTTVTADSGAKIEMELLSDNLIEHGSFDEESDMDFFTTAGTTTKLSDVPDYWRYNSEGWIEALGNSGSGSRQSLQTYIPLNDGEEIGEEKTYYFTMRVKADDKQKALGWNAVTAQSVSNQYDATISGGRYPYYAEGLDNNSMTYVTSDWMTISDVVVADASAKYFIVEGRWLGASDTDPVCFDDIALYEVKTFGAETLLYESDYVVTDTLPEIDGVWSDSEGYITDGVYTRPTIGGIDEITANYSNGEKETFSVEVIGEKVVTSDGGIYTVKSGNLFKNASFEKFYTNNREDGATYPYFPVWESTITGSNSASINNADNGCFYVKDTEQVTGKVSMRGRYDSAYNHNSSFEQKVTVDKGFYYVSFYARKSSLAKKNMEIRIDGEPYFNFYDTATLNSEWQRLSCAVQVDKDDTVLSFDAYNIADVYFDAFSLLEVEGQPTEVTVNIYDENENLIQSEVVDSVVEGAYYSYDRPKIIEKDGKFYVYSSGSSIIESLAKSDNVINLTYREVTMKPFEPVLVNTVDHVAPTLPETVDVEFEDGTTVTLAAEWDDTEESLYAQTGEFSVEGVAEGGFEIEAIVTVTENINYIEGISSTDDFSTQSFKPATGIVEISFDALPLDTYIDGYVGFTGSDSVVEDWTNCPIAVRFYTSGRFQYRDGSAYVDSNAMYEKGKAYFIKIVADLDNKTYSAYVSQKGSNYGIIICENASFRTGADEIEDIAQVCVRGGASSEGGLFTVGNLTVRNAGSLSLIRSYRSDDFNRNYDFIANSTSSAILYSASYCDGALVNVSSEEISFEKGEIKTISKNLKDDEELKLFIWDSQGLLPVADETDSEFIPNTGFTSSFMGSFVFYGNEWDSNIHDEDHKVIQTLRIEVYSDRMEFTMLNHGEVSPGSKELSTYTIKLENGDDSQTDTPILKIACLSDIQIGKTLLTTAEDSVRPVLRTVCENLAPENYDVMLIGGDFVYSSSITKERWDYVMEQYFDLLQTVTPNILVVDGNHDHYPGEAQDFYSGDYYDAYMKEALGILDAENSYWEDDALVAFSYDIGDATYIGLNTSPTMMAGNLQYSNYRYSDGAMDWLEQKLGSLDKDRLIFVVAHIPMRDSNNIISPTKGTQTDVSRRLTDIFAKHPNLVFLYGHDHGGTKAYISYDTSERITRYDENGYKIQMK
jgi:hypothetical protein